MSVMHEETDYASHFLHDNLDKLADECVDFYRRTSDREDPEVYKRRNQLGTFVRKFHEECGTLTQDVLEAVRKLEDGSCLLLMTAHQPNLFAYGGVLRKATLNQVLENKLSNGLKIPVVNFFGIADQDFTDDRWVRSALLPDVQRREGYLDLRFDMPKKVMLNKIPKPSRELLDAWRAEIEKWMNTKARTVERDLGSFGIPFVNQGKRLTENFEDFWNVVEDAYERAEKYADFNAFVMSWIINRVWGYGTLFARFSECQQVFEKEFCFLLSEFDDYSRCVKEATVQETNSEAGVCEQEFETAPFWYHCSCGSKARLNVGLTDGHLVGKGHCIRCNEEYQLDFGSESDPMISEIASTISARSISMPIVFFQGLKVGCYVGGAGGTVYLKQAQYVSERLRTLFPPVAVWRPKDSYPGIGQLEALLVFKGISGTFDLSRFPEVADSLRERIAKVQNEVEELEQEKVRVCKGSFGRKEEQAQNLKVLSAKQGELRRKADFSLMMRNLGLLENVNAALKLHPCIIDYAVNVGLKKTSEQWIDFLQKNGSLLSNVALRAVFSDVEACIKSGVGG